jgi:hypothetical protein
MGEGLYMKINHTEFLIKVVGGEEIEFCHTARSVREFWEMHRDDEVIFDCYDFQYVRREDIKHIRLCLAPYAIGYISTFRRVHRDSYELMNWMDTLSEEEKDNMVSEYYASEKFKNRSGI